jgi:hypothetical protein
MYLTKSRVCVASKDLVPYDMQERPQFHLAQHHLELRVVMS